MEDEDWFAVHLPLCGEQWGVATLVDYEGETYRIERIVPPAPELTDYASNIGANAG